MSDVRTKWHLQDSPDEGWVTIASAPTRKYRTEDDLIAFAEKIRENVRSQPGRTYDGGHRIIMVSAVTSWLGEADELTADEVI